MYSSNCSVLQFLFPIFLCHVCSLVCCPQVWLLGDLWHICSPSTQGADRKADIWWEMDRKWERLEALFELWCCYFHTSSFPALSTHPTTSSDWTGSITVSGGNRLHCCFYYILHPPLSNSLVQTPAGYLFVMCFSHLSLSSSSLQPESICVNGSLSLAQDLWTWCLCKQAKAGQKLPHAASLNHVQLNLIFFLNLQEYALVFKRGKTLKL